MPRGHGTSGTGLRGDGEGDADRLGGRVGVGVGVGEESSPVTTVGGGLCGAVIGPIVRTIVATATTVITRTNSTATTATIQNTGDRPPGDSGGRGGGGWCGSSVVSVDHRVPSQWRNRPGAPPGSGYQPVRPSDTPSAPLAPAVRDRQPTVAAKGLEADLGARWVLAALVLRLVHQSGHPVHQRGIEAHVDDL